MTSPIPSLTSQRVIVGPVSTFKELPVRVELLSRFYYVTRSEKGYLLLSTICPHQGGDVAFKGTHYECSVHGWQFHKTGQCINAPRVSLETIPLREENGQLIADLPIGMNSLTQEPRISQIPSSLDIRLHAHACLEIRHKQFSLITDPWLNGPAFLGAWIHYPPPLIKPKDLLPDAVWISHEHSDHFHEPTLMQWPRNIPIYFPDFPNRRLLQRLTELGFTNIHPMPFGKRFKLTEDFAVTCFEPQSLWNDSVLLIETEKFRILNLNDAGLNQRIASRVHPVDLITSAFTFGASGYPLTWTHLSDVQKVQIMEKTCRGILEMLHKAAQLYGASRLLPFAGHFTLWHPRHRKYIEKMRKNTVQDVVDSFAGTGVQIIDLLPGESWNPFHNYFSRLPAERAKYYDKNFALTYAKRVFDAERFHGAYPINKVLPQKLVKDYFLRLNQSPDIAFCEDVSVRIKALQEETIICDISFQIQHGHLTLCSMPLDHANILMEIPSEILAKIVENDLSWDEAHIGYWCRFSRDPDIYHAGFWRLIQAPYYAKPTGILPVSETIGRHSIIAELLEKLGDKADRIMRRYGLYCVGCQHSICENVETGAKQHGLEEKQIEQLVTELKQLT